MSRGTVRSEERNEERRVPLDPRLCRSGRPFGVGFAWHSVSSVWHGAQVPLASCSKGTSSRFNTVDCKPPTAKGTTVVLNHFELRGPFVQFSSFCENM